MCRKRKSNKFMHFRHLEYLMFILDFFVYELYLHLLFNEVMKLWMLFESYNARYQ